MNHTILFVSILGFLLVFFPVVVGARYVGKWRSEDHRLKRRMRDLG